MQPSMSNIQPLSKAQCEDFWHLVSMNQDTLLEYKQSGNTELLQPLLKMLKDLHPELTLLLRPHADSEQRSQLVLSGRGHAGAAPYVRQLCNAAPPLSSLDVIAFIPPISDLDRLVHADLSLSEVTFSLSCDGNRHFALTLYVNNLNGSGDPRLPELIPLVFKALGEEIIADSISKIFFSKMPSQSSMDIYPGVEIQRVLNAAIDSRDHGGKLH